MQKYEPPTLTVLGTVRDLTLMPPANPPGKTGVAHDGSDFVANFSFVGGN